MILRRTQVKFLTKISKEGKKKETTRIDRHTHKGVIAEKFKGHIPAQTPRGSLMEYVSIPLDVLGINSPTCRVAIPHTCSTTSTSKRKAMSPYSHKGTVIVKEKATRQIKN